MSYQAYVVELKDIKPHPNADRLKLATVFGNIVAVSLDYEPGMVCVYFPTDGQLSEEFCRVHDLVRRKNPETGEYEGGYMDPAKRNVKTIKLRGEPSDGLLMPISCLDYCFEDGNAVDKLSIGDTIDVVNGHEICKKYIPRSNHRVGKPSDGNRTRKKKVPIAPLFAEHADTEQLAYNLGAFRPGDHIEITLKMHGTSQRTGYLPTLIGWTGPNLAVSIVNGKGILSKLGKIKALNKWANNNVKPLYDWGYVSGTRRTVLENFEGGFYGDNHFRQQHHDKFVDKLHKGETVYYEVVGFTDQGTPIMGQCSNSKTNDKAFIKQYGDITTFSYGCHPHGWNDRDGGYNSGRNEPQSDIYVYRMTMTNEDGDVVEYTPDFMRYRCEQMGVKTVPVFWNGFIPEVTSPTHFGREDAFGEWVQTVAQNYFDGKDPIGNHIREGIVVRIVNRPKFCAYKHKNIYFKMLEGIYKESSDGPDMEESQEILDNN